MIDPEAKPCIFTSMKYEAAAFATQLRFITSWDGMSSPGILFKWGLFALDNKYNTWVSHMDAGYYETVPGPIFDELGPEFGSTPYRQGRLAQSFEGAGKRRLFLIGNWFKQRLLHPAHA